MATKYLRDANGNYLRDANGKLLTVSSDGGSSLENVEMLDMFMGVVQAPQTDDGIYWVEKAEVRASDDLILKEFDVMHHIPMIAGNGIEFVDEGGSISINNTFSNIPIDIGHGDSLGDYLTSSSYYHMIVECMPDTSNGTAGNLEFPDDDNGNQAVSIPGGLYHACHFRGRTYFAPMDARYFNTYCVYDNHVIGSGTIVGHAIFYGYGF